MLFKVLAFVLAGVHLAVGTPAVVEGSLVERGVVERDVAVTHSGDGTFFTPGLGACGWTSKSSDLIVALGHAQFDSGDFCGRGLTATYNGKSVSVKVVDRCEGCDQYDLDFSPSAFDKLASRNDGRIYNVKWHFLAPGQ